MSKLRLEFPLLARHEGVWDGSYLYVDVQGQLIDQHSSRLVCSFPDSGDIDYDQTNHYRWADGRTEVRAFPAVSGGDRIVFKSELIDGWAAAMPMDLSARTIMLHWVRKGEPGVYLYEMIQLSDCGQFRSRTWHWFRDGRLFQRTLIDEHKVSTRWQTLQGPSYAGDPIPD